MTTSSITIANITIKQDQESRYCLNDLHKAAGGSRKDQPTNWQRTAKTQGLIQSLRNSSEMRISPVSRTTGRNGGTFVVKELVYAYAMWISPAFHLKVIRAYDTLQTQGVAVADHAAADLLANPLAYFEFVARSPVAYLWGFSLGYSSYVING